MTASPPESAAPYRVIIVDDEPLAREGLRDAIARVGVPNVEVIEAEALDFLVKPVADARLAAALERAVRRVAEARTLRASLDAPSAAEPAAAPRYLQGTSCARFALSRHTPTALCSLLMPECQ